MLLLWDYWLRLRHSSTYRERRYSCSYHQNTTYYGSIGGGEGHGRQLSLPLSRKSKNLFSSKKFRQPSSIVLWNHTMYFSLLSLPGGQRSWERLIVGGGRRPGKWGYVMFNRPCTRDLISGCNFQSPKYARARCVLLVFCPPILKILPMPLHYHSIIIHHSTLGELTVCLCLQDGRNALYMAASQGKIAVVRVLIEAKALVNIQNKVYTTLCHISSSHDREELRTCLYNYYMLL